MATRKTLNKCPKCGEPLEATLKLYLSNVVFDTKSGTVLSYDIGRRWQAVYPLMNPDETITQYVHNEIINPLVQGAEGDELIIYCRNDHQISPEVD